MAKTRADTLGAAFLVMAVALVALVVLVFILARDSTVSLVVAASPVDEVTPGDDVSDMAVTTAVVVIAVKTTTTATHTTSHFLPFMIGPPLMTFIESKSL